MNKRDIPQSLGPYRALVFALILACGSPTGVFAADGWLLWFRQIVLAESDGTGKPVTMSQQPVWEPSEGFALFADCRKRATDTLTAYTSAYAKAMKAEKANLLLLGGLPLGDNTVTLELPSGTAGAKQFVTTSAACFPGGFDPRPR